MNKLELRTSLRKIRGELGYEQRQAAALSAANLLSLSALFQKSQNVACYAACQNEFETLPIIEMIWRAKKKCYLPVLSTLQSKTLDFYRYDEADSLIVNQYGIPEPLTSGCSPLPVAELDLVLVPVVGFDLQGNRLGTGGGYYDRTFAFLLQHAKPHTPCLIGLAYQSQAVDELPSDVWDVPLDGILTEKKFIV